MGKIFIQGLAVEARVGVYKREHGKRQPLSFDLEVAFADVARAAVSEELADTLNYEQLASIAREVVERRHYPLVETLARTIGQELLRLPGVVSARVRLRKIGCLPGVDAAGTELRVEREAFEEADDHPRAVGSELVADEEPLVVVGGGVAGLAATLWCARLGRPALLIDPGPQLGGQLHQVHFEMTDLPGMPPSNGIALARRLWTALPRATRWWTARLSACQADADGATLTVVDDQGAERIVRARALIVAMGLSRRSIAVPGERELRGRGLLATASRGIEGLAGERVAVIGGGDGACENALKLVRAGAHVVLLHHGAALSAREEFRRAVGDEPAIELRLGATVARFCGTEALEAVELDDGSRIAARHALVRVGWVPHSRSLPAAWLDEGGYVRCDPSLRVVGEARVFVAGDLRNPPAPSVAASVGDGANAAKGATQLLDQ